jgi:hypothetical protein
VNYIKANRIILLYGALISLISGCYAGAASAAQVPVGREPEFEVNRGQHDRAVLYLLRMPGFDTALVQNGAMFRFPGGGQLSMRFVNANQRVETIPSEITGHRANYFLGETANATYTDVPHYRQVRYQSIYPGIDLVFYGDQGKLEYDLNLQTGADPEQIELAFDGASAIKVLEDGSADISTRTGTLHQYAPRVYQEVNGKRQKIPARFVRGSDNTLRFALSTYDRTRPLVIDPVLSYSSYLGGSSGDAGVAVAVDASGNAYVTGITTSTNFPVQNAYKTSKSGTTDIFVAKLTPDGVVGIIWEARADAGSQACFPAEVVRPCDRRTVWRNGSNEGDIETRTVVRLTSSKREVGRISVAGNISGSLQVNRNGVGRIRR